MKKQVGIQEIGWLIVLSMIWGSSFSLIKGAVSWMPPLLVVSGRLAIATLIFIVIFAHMTIPRHHWRQYGHGYIVIGACGNVIPFTLVGWSEQVMDSALAAIIVGLMPFFTLLFTHLMTRDERLTRRRLLGIVLGLLGIILLQGFELTLKMGSSAAVLAMVTSTISYGFAAAYARRCDGHNALILAGYSIIVGFLLCVPFALYHHWHWLMTPRPFDINATLAVVLLGVVNTALGGLIFFRILFRSGALFASASNYLMPLFGVSFGVIFWNETLGINAIVAMIFIMLGCVCLAPPQKKSRF